MVAIVPHTGLACCAALLATSLYTAPARAGTANAAVTDTAAAKPRTLGFAVTSFPYPIYKGAAGSAGGRIKTGIHVSAVGEPITRIGLTLQQVMDVPVEKWGQGSMQTSKPVSEILI